MVRCVELALLVPRTTWYEAIRLRDARDLESKTVVEVNYGLQSLCSLAFPGMHLPKPRHVTMSDWEAPTLSDDQVLYAAADAFYGLQVHLTDRVLEMCWLSDVWCLQLTMKLLGLISLLQCLCIQIFTSMLHARSRASVLPNDNVLLFDATGASSTAVCDGHCTLHSDTHTCVLQ